MPATSSSRFVHRLMPIERARGHGEVGHLRQAARLEHVLHLPLVDVHRARRDVGADVGNAEAREEPLDGPVLAVGAMEHGEADVDRAEGGPADVVGLAVLVEHDEPRALAGLDERDGVAVVGDDRELVALGLGDAVEQRPAARLRDADGRDDVALLVERRQHVARRQAADLVLARSAAEQDEHPQGLVRGGIGRGDARHAQAPGRPWNSDFGSRPMRAPAISVTGMPSWTTLTTCSTMGISTP
jgi:hypothetical protein